MERWVVMLACATAACASDPQPSVDGVSPDHWREPFPPDQIRISGENLHGSLRVNLQPGGGVRTPTTFSGELGGEPLEEIVWENNLELTAVPPRLPAGSHELVLRTPAGLVARLDDAVTVLPVGVGAIEAGDSGAVPIAPASDQPGCDTGQPIEYLASVDPAVEPSRSVLFFNYAVDSYEPRTGSLSGMLDSTGNQVTFARGGDNGIGIDISWSVLQIAGADVQRGEVQGQATVTLDRPVSASRSFALVSWRACGYDYDGLDWALTRLLCASDACDQVEIVVSGGDGGYADWQVVELEAGTGAEVLSGDFTLTTEESLDISLAHPVDPTASFLVFSQTIRGDNDYEYVSNYGIAGDLRPDGTAVSFERQVAAIPDTYRVAVEVAWFVVSWPYFSVQRGRVDLAQSESTVEVTLPSAVDPSAAVSFFPGALRQGSTSYIGPDIVDPLPGNSRNDLVGVIWFQTTLSDDGATLTIHRASDLGPAGGWWNVVELL